MNLFFSSPEWQKDPPNFGLRHLPCPSRVTRKGGTVVMRVQKGPRLLALLGGSLFAGLELLVEDLNPSDVRSE